MKVFIQSNKYQLLAAKVSKYSFEKFGCEVKIMNLEDNIFLKSNFNKKIRRNDKIAHFKDDLQSFTLLRFYAPELNNFSDKILIIDPDIFALKNPKTLFDEIDDSNYDIACTFYNNKPRSEMMLVNAKNLNWNFNKIIKDLFSLKIDYRDLMNLNFDKNLRIKNIDKKFNSHDIINSDTVLLHTTNRITQPWKEGLQVNFERSNLTSFYFFKQHLKKILNLSYDKNSISKIFQKHPDENVINFVKKLFIEARENKIISDKEINEEILNNNISKNFFNLS